jgi:hypothetical protein
MGKAFTSAVTSLLAHDWLQMKTYGILRRVKAMRKIERLSTGLLPVETNDILCYETKVEGGRKRLRQRDARQLALRRTRRYFGA